MVVKITIPKDVWLTIDVYRTMPDDTAIVETDQYVCYYRYKEVSAFDGEILRDENNKLLLFSTPNEAINYAREFLTNSLK